MKKVILYIATSQDDFVADKDGGVGWLPQPDQGDVATGSHDFKTVLDRVDTIIMGSKSYKQILTFGDWAWPDKHSYILSSKKIDVPLPCITVTKKSPTELMQKIRSEGKQGKDIWLLGGAGVARSFEKEGLIDEILLSFIPKTLGEGIPLGLSYDGFELKNEETLANGMIQRAYLRKSA
ncbi:predicted protein [Nematostella vectensis]|uniref:Bacterial bifunctional deaminase-reductase C-terminal domain-containing protein n=1 Tax=Nematostella vectensis TaxID=45351 RepID=A7RUJ1_NEMVE|nr:predicted protein [Nematostella vectensis]|eukprot:XP_001636926.1 predicted protein [Nematostella vectensis]